MNGLGDELTNDDGLNPDGRARLSDLREDFAEVTGKPFETFYCPVLFRDEDVELCRAHIINRAFRDSSRIWTIQRSDVDSWFGSMFESDFLVMQEARRHSPVDALRDRRLSHQLNPAITVDGDTIEHYLSSGQVPDTHTPVSVETPGSSVELVLKVEPSEVLSRAGDSWEITIERDLRLSTLVSVLKAAHLTLFHLLGYSYALSAGGLFAGKDILGSFFDANSGLSRREVLAAAEPHFSQFCNLVRPLLGGDEDVTGTVHDGHLYLCGAGQPWAVLVVIRTGEVRHAALMPVGNSVDAIAYFARFLDAPTDELAVRRAIYKGDRFEAADRLDTLAWPAANYH